MKVATLNKHFHPYIWNEISFENYSTFSLFLFIFLYFHLLCALYTHTRVVYMYIEYREYWAAVNRNSMCRSIGFAKWKIFDFAHLNKKQIQSKAKQTFFNLFDNFSKSYNEMMKNYLWNVHIQVQSQTKCL